MSITSPLLLFSKLDKITRKGFFSILFTHRSVLNEMYYICSWLTTKNSYYLKKKINNRQSKTSSLIKLLIDMTMHDNM